MSDLVGSDLHELAGEVDKLATWAGGEVVTAADVEALVTPRAESPPWALTDAWGARDVGGVLRAAERMLDRTGDPVSRTLPRLVGGLTKHVRNARAAQRLEEQGLSSAEAASRLGMKPYPAQKLYAQVRNFSPAELDGALVRLADLDHALKGGSRVAPELELERALVEITALAARTPQRATASTPAARRATWDFFRAAALRCSAPRATARSISCSRLRRSVAIAEASPSETAVERRFVSVLIVER